MNSREQRRREFLARIGWGEAIVAPLARDASFRSYDRVGLGSESAVLMDAPPEHEETLPFHALSHWLLAQGFSAPIVMAADRAQGFLLLEDLGDDRFTRLLAASPIIEGDLYASAVDLLGALHGRPVDIQIPLECGAVYLLPPYDMTTLMREAHLFEEYYMPMLGVPQSDKLDFVALWETALTTVSKSRDVIVLRDYHADNLMWLPARDGVRQIGLLDFQDALIGHRAYDLVSLLQDARRDVAPETERQMLDRYADRAAAAHEDFSKADFERDYALLGAQRNTKIIGIFSRLWVRDKKPHYLGLIPRVWGLLERDLAHSTLAPLRDWFDAHVPKALRAIPLKTDGSAA